MLEYIHRI